MPEPGEGGTREKLFICVWVYEEGPEGEGAVRGPGLENLPRITKRLYSRRALPPSLSRFLLSFLLSSTVVVSGKAVETRGIQRWVELVK